MEFVTAEATFKVNHPTPTHTQAHIVATRQCWRDPVCAAGETFEKAPQLRLLLPGWSQRSNASAG